MEGSSVNCGTSVLQIVGYTSADNEAKLRGKLVKDFCVKSCHHCDGGNDSPTQPASDGTDCAAFLDCNSCLHDSTTHSGFFGLRANQACEWSGNHCHACPSLPDEACHNRQTVVCGTDATDPSSETHEEDGNGQGDLDIHSIENADPCHSAPCQNGGKCNVWDDTAGDIEYHCKCPHGYAQPNCQNL
jgi:hypothetical protein